TPPLTSAAVNIAAGKNFMYEETTLGGELVNLAPISVRGIYEQIQRDGASSFITEGLPTFIGFNVKDERDYQDKTNWTEEDKKNPVYKTFIDAKVELPNTNPKSIEVDFKEGKPVRLSDKPQDIQDK